MICSIAALRTTATIAKFSRTYRRGAIARACKPISGSLQGLPRGDLTYRMSMPMREFTGIDAEAVRREVLADKQPAIVRGLVEAWPAVAAARESPSALVRYLTRFDTGAPVDALLAPPEIDGRIFYNESMTGFNFVRNRLPLTAVADQVLRYSLFPKAPSVAAQSALIRDCAPGFLAENRLRCSMRASRRVSGSAIASRLRCISTPTITSHASLPAGGASRCFRRSRSPISMSARSILRPPAHR